MSCLAMVINSIMNALYRYGYHTGFVSYYLCYDPTVIQRIFKRLRHFDGTERSVRVRQSILINCFLTHFSCD